MLNKKILSVFMAMIMIISVFSVSISASDNKEISFTLDCPVKDMINTGKINNKITVNNKAVSVTGTDYKFYDYISPDAKAVYDGILTADAGISSENKGVIKIDLSAFGSNYTQEALIYAICYACAALSDDYPEYQWILSAPFTVLYKSASGILQLTINLSQLPYNSWQELETEYYALLNAVNEFPVEGKNRYEKVKSIHDNLARLAEYSTDISNTTSPFNSKVFFPSSALLSPNETVCDGYSKAFKMICDKNNIPCIVVTGYAYSLVVLGVPVLGGGHTWNYVQMEDGKWYAVDLTWDDQVSGKPIYDYFLVGENTLDSMGKSFASTHDPKGDRFENTYLTYPKLSANAYVYDANAYITGDVTGDGYISIADAKLILQCVSGLKALNEKQLAAADINADSNITVVDAKRILQFIAGIRPLSQ